MTTQESKQQYEGAILQQLIKNSERLVVVEQKIAVVEQDVSQLKKDMEYVKPTIENIDKTLGSIKWILATIGLAIIANIFSQPINNFLFKLILGKLIIYNPFFLSSSSWSAIDNKRQ